tara:strand:+ start:601 stop:726 length:126 start_codon:yes stop_codon:yes gene_type:complete
MTLKTLTFLEISAIINKIGNYFYRKHVESLHEEQRKQGLRR